MIPKVEIHCHIEGAAPPSLVQRLAKKYQIDLSGIFDAEGNYKWTDFTTFLSTYDSASSVFRNPEDFEELSYTHFSESARLGAIYCEVFISAEHAQKAGISYDSYVEGLASGIEKAKTKTGIEGRMIATGVRHFGVEKVEEAAKTAVKFPHPLVTGFGMAGDERVGQVADFVKAFQIAQDAGLLITTHAGEFGGPESVIDSLKYLKLNRIGHGVRSIEDPELVKRLVNEEIVLELCPSSNIATGLYQSIEDHPIQQLDNAGVLITVSTDDPPYFDTDIAREYDQLATKLSWTDARLRELSHVALKAAFCDEETKARLLSKV